MILFRRYKSFFLPVLTLIALIFLIVLVGKNLFSETDILFNGKVVEENVRWFAPAFFSLFALSSLLLLIYLFQPTKVEFFPLEAFFVIREYNMISANHYMKIPVRAIKNIHVYVSKELELRRDSSTEFYFSTEYIVYGIMSDGKLIKLGSFLNFKQYEKFFDFITDPLDKSIPLVDLNEFPGIDGRIDYENNYQTYIR